MGKALACAIHKKIDSSRCSIPPTKGIIYNTLARDNIRPNTSFAARFATHSCSHGSKAARALQTIIVKVASVKIPSKK
jgi:hypothetical protein